MTLYLNRAVRKQHAIQNIHSKKSIYILISKQGMFCEYIRIHTYCAPVNDGNRFWFWWAMTRQPWLAWYSAEIASKHLWNCVGCSIGLPWCWPRLWPRKSTAMLTTLLLCFAEAKWVSNQIKGKFRLNCFCYDSCGGGPEHTSRETVTLLGDASPYKTIPCCGCALRLWPSHVRIVHYIHWMYYIHK